MALPEVGTTRRGGSVEEATEWAVPRPADGGTDPTVEVVRPTIPVAAARAKRQLLPLGA
jgi:hypothetical protein